MKARKKKLRVLVTGASGFLGGIFCRRLRPIRIEPVAACRNPENLPSVYSGEIRRGDLLDADYRRSLAQDIDVLCHAALSSRLWLRLVEGDASGFVAVSDPLHCASECKLAMPKPVRPQ